ncbi:hypothetical protein QBC32DRAFT_341352 [Pseudoneurospora amorphoporcata]|uniref:Uncharacterized protein n=1 Tax=Pseudoneurospora amorphoporcata TaxID=241081 RepID=A0AAN6SGK5_9PEZI|nr:hypothetical protein QBC32DRAFT_341352 [Pseudoneurospora amorphoporcata]
MFFVHSFFLLSVFPFFAFPLHINIAFQYLHSSLKSGLAYSRNGTLCYRVYFLSGSFYRDACMSLSLYSSLHTKGRPIV